MGLLYRMVIIMTMPPHEALAMPICHSLEACRILFSLTARDPPVGFSPDLSIVSNGEHESTEIKHEGSFSHGMAPDGLRSMAAPFNKSDSEPHAQDTVAAFGRDRVESDTGPLARNGGTPQSHPPAPFAGALSVRELMHASPVAFPLPLVGRIARHMCEALVHFHMCTAQPHNAVRLQNVFVTETTVVLGPPDMEFLCPDYDRVVFKDSYCAPELRHFAATQQSIDFARLATEKADVWSVASCVWSMVTKSPFTGEVTPFALPDALPPPVATAILDSLSARPQTRPTLVELLAAFVYLQ